jgi:methyltransferase (TIGR00027 family)
MKQNSASSTAKVIAASTIFLANTAEHRHLVAPGAKALCELFLQTSASDQFLAYCAKNAVLRLLCKGLEQATLPGIMIHYWQRKRWIEQQLVAALEQGFERVVILGAGFDTLALRLAPQFKGVQWVEIDHPATQAVKQQALAKANWAIPSNVRFNPADLQEQPINRASLGTDCNTLFVMEGLLMYLTQEQVRAVLSKLNSGGFQTQLIFSFMQQWPSGPAGFRPYSRLIDRWLKTQAEPFDWAISPEAVAPFLNASGFCLQTLCLTKAFSPTVSLEGENLVVAVKTVA